MAFYLYVLGVLTVGGLLAWNIHYQKRMSTASAKDVTNAIRFLAFDKTPYILSPQDHPSDCYVRDEFGAVATFELMSLRGDAFNTLHIGHFALDSSLKGQGFGETVLRGFAQLVSDQAPQIDRITFSLSRHTEESNIIKLSTAREKLLTKLKARGVHQYHPNNKGDCICVTGTWEKTDWTK